ncbi:hypothetical protein [Burkholderia sp. LMG 21824]
MSNYAIIENGNVINVVVWGGEPVAGSLTTLLHACRKQLNQT